MKTHGTAISTAEWRQLRSLNAGLDVLRERVGGSCPPDFSWAFMMADSDLVLTWSWAGASGYCGEIRVTAEAELLVQWERIDWVVERRAAQTFRGYFAGV